MGSNQNVETIEFPCEEWVAARNGDTGELVGLDPVPGTWTLIGGEDRRRFSERGMNVKAMFACPRCNQIGAIPEGFKPPTKFGDAELPEMHCRKCKFGCRVVLKEWDRRKLYCISYEAKKGDSFDTHKEYLHAEDQDEALKFFWAQHGGQVIVATGNEKFDGVMFKDGMITNVVGVAPVVGFFALNPKNERKLIV